ncbi:MAG: hypothetical protein EZS28_007954 [Streblomastix strix]|uniref:Uncharacterized protein n=1 Tax=Streblomastix strix TaxID=222440 RepID=A0A5J4WP45_9EUKA|nr:MAG: hypothetical protein EZS28_007954 [Streblomastix strix]
MNYTQPTDLASFAKDFGNKDNESKGLFPYEGITYANYNYELNKSQLFPIKAFDSMLKNKTMYDDDYLLYLSDAQNYATRWDYLQHYNELDTQIMIQPLDNPINWFIYALQLSVYLYPWCQQIKVQSNLDELNPIIDTFYLQDIALAKLKPSVSSSYLLSIKSCLASSNTNSIHYVIKSSPQRKSQYIIFNAAYPNGVAIFMYLSSFQYYSHHLSLICDATDRGSNTEIHQLLQIAESLFNGLQKQVLTFRSTVSKSYVLQYYVGLNY